MVVQLSTLDTERMTALEEAALKAQALHLAKQVITHVHMRHAAWHGHHALQLDGAY